MGAHTLILYTWFKLLLIGATIQASTNQLDLIRQFMKTTQVKEVRPLTPDDFSSSELPPFARLTRIRESATSTNVTAIKPLSSSTKTSPAANTTTPARPPTDPRDACKGCPAGQACQMFVPPCWRGPPGCARLIPDPELNCAGFVCTPVALCSIP
ncbi:unnamed protein product [Lymnaea stagnalis]|uniref:Uncharacterized protein n=1 Tax=Lymnaea stagnalis TaxID=6523 RepID=A0AAV2H6K5_LYMST